MNSNIEKTINEIIENIIKNSVQEKKINKIKSIHSVKTHFIPKKYRILGGILQSMNIRFGNFIEELIKKIIEKEENLEILYDISGSKRNKFKISLKNEKLIDSYITKCQIENIDIYEEFAKLKKELLENEKETFDIINEIEKNYIVVNHDIDLLFKDKIENKIYYVEIKYNDDHDTGKFIDINRKFLKTYAYLLNKFEVKDVNEVEPILYYFNNKKLKGNIYIPEKMNIMRGKSFFDKFLSMNYSEIEEYLTNLSEKQEIIKMFDELYKKIMNI